MDLRRHLVFVVAANLSVLVIPLLLGLELAGGNVLLSIVWAVALSVGVSTLGAALWQRFDSSDDLVFDDLLLWGYVRRIRARRDPEAIASRLRGSVDGAAEDDPRERLRLLKRLAVALETGDPFTDGHSRRVSRHCLMIARAMGLSRRFSKKVELAGLLHDVGKLYLPKEILLKPGPLTDEEYEIVKTHAAISAQIVDTLGDAELTAMVLGHHERMDGRGYPNGASGGRIPLGSRIIAVADTFDAITSERPYRAARKHRVAIEILQAGAGSQLDPGAVKAFLSYYSGRRSLFRWQTTFSALRVGPESLFAAIGRAGVAGAANAAVIGGTTAALITGGLVPNPMDRGRETPPARRVEATADPASGTQPLSWIDSETSPSGDGFATQGRRKGPSGPPGGKGKPNESPADKGRSVAAGPPADKGKPEGPSPAEEKSGGKPGAGAPGSGKQPAEGNDPGATDPELPGDLKPEPQELLPGSPGRDSQGRAKG